ncbi:MAG: O-antigen ligase family protein, partial [Elusimicrobiota bacterium]|nr:O-antigen ligase family protein [Elusimicrobiota bacterium]
MSKLLKPYIYVMLTVFLTVLGGVSLYKIGPVNFRPYQIPLLIASILLISQFLVSKKKIIFPRSYFFSLFLLLIAIFISLFAAPFPLLTIKQTILLGLFIILFFLIINTCDSEKRIIMLHKIIIYSCILCCIYGLYKMITLNLPGVPKEGGYAYTRPKSFFVEPNEFGQYLVFAFGYVFSELLSGRKITNRIILWCTFFLIVFLIVPNMSRGAWLGCIISMFVIFYYQNKYKIKKINLNRKIKIVIVVFFLSVVSITVLSKYLPTNLNISAGKIIKSRALSIFGGSDATSSIRWENNKKAFDAMMKYPFTGVGFGNEFVVMEENAGNYGENVLPDVVAATSSNFLSDIGMATGVLGFS